MILFKRIKITGDNDVSAFLRRAMVKDKNGLCTYREIYDRYKASTNYKEFSYSRFTQLLREHFLNHNDWIAIGKGGGGTIVLLGVKVK